MAYIDRDKVIEALKDNVTEMESDIYYGSNLGVPEDEIEDIINEIPTEDVVEIKHGKWKDSGNCDWRCTNCNEYFTLDIDMHPIDDCGMNYCPNCGAKMDLKE